MLELVVRDGWTQGNPFVGFTSMCILVPREAEKAKAANEEMWDAIFKSWIQCNPRD